MNAKRWWCMLVIVAGLMLLAACVGDEGRSLADEQERAQNRALAAGQTAVALQDWIRATAAAEQYATAQAAQAAMVATENARHTIVVATSQAQATGTVRAQATSSAAADLVLRATIAAASTMSALDAAQKALDLRAQGDAVEYQKRMFEEQLKREEVTTRMQQWGETAKAAFGLTLSRIIPAVGLLGLLYLALLAGKVEIERRARRAQVIERGQHGLLPAVIDERGDIHVLDLQFWSSSNSGEAPIEAQARVADMQKRVQGVAALSAGGRAPSVRGVANILTPAAAPAGSAEGAEEVFNAEWRWLDDNWRPGRGFPLGLGAGGAEISLDPEKNPHLMIAGTTGSGKTLRGALPLAATALASGWQVVVANGAAADFEPVSWHPNLVEIRGNPERMADLLEAVARLVDERDQFLAEHHATTWSRLPFGAADGPNVMVIVDELVALAWQAQTESPKLAARLWNAAIHITSKGRKMGISLVVVTTDPTYRTLGKQGLTVRDNCSREIFRLRDRAVSQAALDADGAETLAEDQFLAQLGNGLVRGMAFKPTGEEIRRFLERNQARALPKPEWVEGETVSQRGSEQEQRILDLMAQGKSMNEIQMAVFGYTGGAAYQAVKAVLSGTTTESGEDAGSTGSSTGSSSTPHPRLERTPGTCGQPLSDTERGESEADE